MEHIPDGWSSFALDIIAELKKYDAEHKTFYARTIASHDGVFVLAHVLRTVNRANTWERVPNSQSKGVH